MKKITIILLFVLLPLVSTGSLHAQSPSPVDYLREWQTSQTTDKTNPNTIRLELNRLLMEHGTIATLHLTSLYDGKSIAKTRELLGENAEKVATLYVSTTNGSSEQFLSLWNQHIKSYERYTLAVKNKNKNNQQMARTDLAEISQKLGQLFDFKNRIISSDMIAKHMKEHADGTLAIVDAHALSDHDEEIARIKAATEQAKIFADILAATLANNR